MRDGVCPVTGCFRPETAYPVAVHVGRPPRLADDRIAAFPDRVLHPSGVVVPFVPR